MTKLLLVNLCVVISSALALASGQAGPQATLSLGGRVVDAASQRPVPGAAVTVRGSAPLPDPPILLADAEGRFRFDQLRAGRYTLTATALGYLSGGGEHIESGMAPAEVAVTLDAGVSRIDLRIGLIRPAAIYGIVVDSDNAPVESAQLGALREVFVAGVRRFQVGASATADDAGQFRFSSLAPGRYIVCVVGERVTVPRAWQARFDEVAAGTRQEQMMFTMQARQSGALMGAANRGFAVGDFWLKPGNISVGPLATSDGQVWSAPDVCNGGARSPLRAPVITLAAGEQRLGETLVVDLDPAPSVSGRVSGPTGPEAWHTVSLESEGFDALGWTEGLPYASTMADAAGRFTLLGVAPGNYILNTYRIAIPMPGGAPGTLPPGETLSARMPITVGRDGIADLEVVMAAAVQPRGRVEFSEGGASPPPAERAAVTPRFVSAEGIVTRAPFLQPTVVVHPDGTFETAGLVQGRYVVTVPPVGRWRLDTAELSGVDVSDVPFVVSAEAQPEMVITLTDRQWQVTGTVRNDQELPVEAGHVVVFPTDRTRWSRQGAQPRRQRMVEVRGGAYVVEALPAGEYFIVALPAGGAGDWQSPEQFARWAATGLRVTLQPHESRTLDLTVGGAR